MKEYVQIHNIHSEVWLNFLKNLYRNKTKIADEYIAQNNPNVVSHEKKLTKAEVGKA